MISKAQAAAPHPFKSSQLGDLPGCIEDLSREHAGISCGKPSSNPIHSVPPSVAALDDVADLRRWIVRTGTQEGDELVMEALDRIEAALRGDR